MGIKPTFILLVEELSDRELYVEGFDFLEEAQSRMTELMTSRPIVVTLCCVLDEGVHK